VTAQIAFTLILVIGAALFARTLTGLMAKGPAFSTSRLISFGIDPYRNGYSPAQTNRLIRRIHAEIRASRNVQTSAVAKFPLLAGGSWNGPMTIQTDRRITTDRDVNLNAVSPEFFATLGTRIIRGRDFNDHARPGPASGSRHSDPLSAPIGHRAGRSHWPTGEQKGLSRLCAFTSRPWFLGVAAPPLSVIILGVTTGSITSATGQPRFQRPG
jgi:hypothetical protein